MSKKKVKKTLNQNIRILIIYLSGKNIKVQKDEMKILELTSQLLYIIYRYTQATEELKMEKRMKERKKIFLHNYTFHIRDKNFLCHLVSLIRDKKFIFEGKNI